MNETLKKKLEDLPDKPGCYMMRDIRGKIIYVGKALSLRKRVRSYFRRGTPLRADPKLKGLIKSVEDIDTVVTNDEAQAILTEGRLIKAYRPKYNRFFKDDKRFLLLKTDLSAPFSRFELCRIRRRDKAVYFGPYVSSAAARCALEFVEKRFGIRRCRPRIPGPVDHKHCINDIVRFCAAPCTGAVTEPEYGARVNEACAFLSGERKDAFKQIEAEMREMIKSLNFEKAAALRDTLRCLWEAVRQKNRAARGPAADIQYALAGIESLGRAAGLDNAPRLIEAYDVSSISGTHAVASVVALLEGAARPDRYRRFRIRTADAADDASMIAEAVRRRFERLLREGGRLPDLVIVDGGAGQLRAALMALRKLGLKQMPIIGFAKRFEDIYCLDSASTERGNIRLITLDGGSPAMNLLRRVRDEAHRFALDYHRKLRARKIRESALDEVPGLGEKRKMLLLQRFGSVARLAEADAATIASVPGIGPKIAASIKDRVS